MTKEDELNEIDETVELIEAEVTRRGGPRHRPVLSFGYDGSPSRRYPSLSRACELSGHSHFYLRQALNGMGNFTNHNLGGRLWFYEDEFSEELLMSCSEKLESNKRRNEPRPVAMLDPETGKVIKRFRSAKNAAKCTGVFLRTIINAANGKHRLGGGYRWRWVRKRREVCLDEKEKEKKK